MVGVVIDASDRVLIAQRVHGKHHAGQWEFPGGKLESGEPRRVGLARELREELGISIESPRPLIRVSHRYSYGTVLLDVWVIRHYSGPATGLDGQAVRWCELRNLASADLLPADKPIIAALSLPDRLTQESADDFIIEKFGAKRGNVCNKLRGVLCSDSREAQSAASDQADFIVLRNPMSSPELITLCEAIAVPVFAAGLDLETAWGLGASGLNQLRA
jgi:mutator protein MutT